jgi:lipoprotein-releasing system permease protein
MRFAWNLALKHLFSSKVQSLLVILAVGLGVLVIVFIPALNDGFYIELLDKTINTSPHIRITRPDEIGKITNLKIINNDWHLFHDKTTLQNRYIQSYQGIIKKINTIPGIIGIAPYITDSGSLINGDKNLNVQYNGILYPEYQSVVDIDKELVAGGYDKMAPDGIVISSKIAENLRAELNDTLILTTTQGRRTLKIVGLYNSGFISKDNTTTYISLSTAQNLGNIGNQVDGIGIRVMDPWHVEDISRKLYFRTGLQVKTWKDDNESLLTEIGSFTYIMFLINFTIMMAVASGVLGIMIILINSKYKQIGMFKALGVTSKGVINIFVIEGFLLAIIGAIVGCLFATALIAFYNANPIPISENYGVSEIKGVYKASIYLQAFFLAIISGCVAAFIPSYFASKLDPAEVLKS